MKKFLSIISIAFCALFSLPGFAFPSIGEIIANKIRSFSFGSMTLKEAARIERNQEQALLQYLLTEAGPNASYAVVSAIASCETRGLAFAPPGHMLRYDPKLCAMTIDEAIEIAKRNK